MKYHWNEIRDKKNPELKPAFDMNDLQGTYFNEQAGNLDISVKQIMI